MSSQKTGFAGSMKTDPADGLCLLLEALQFRDFALTMLIPCLTGHVLDA
jgi:hypothetical protein